MKHSLHYEGPSRQIGALPGPGDGALGSGAALSRLSLLSLHVDLRDALGSRGLGLVRRHGMLPALVRAELMARTLASVPVSEQERQELLEAFWRSRNASDPIAQQEVLRQLGIDEADLEWQVLLPLRSQRYAQEEFGHKAESRFLERKNQLDQVTYSLIRLKDAGLARELYLRIAGAEASFSDIASQYSEGPERQTQGLVGPKPLTNAHPILAERLRTARTGELLAPIRVADWWLVTRVEKFVHATFDSVTTARMCSELFEEMIDSQTIAVIQSFPSLA